MRKNTFALPAVIALAACQPTPAPEAVVPAPVAIATAPTPTGATAAERGLAFAQRHCSQCHAVTADAVSSNPDSPPFEMIANSPGVTKESLTTWLHNSHDFPAEMYFIIADEHIDDLAAHVLTLRRKDYEPPIQ